MSDTTVPANSESGKMFRCSACEGSLEFKPGQDSMVCPYCGSNEQIQGVKKLESFVELDFESAKAEFSRLSTEEVRIVSCQSCGGESTMAPNVESGECHFCGTKLIASGPSSKAMKPQYVLPFKVDKNAASESFKTWLKKLWFAPNALKSMASVDSPLRGIYFPFWTFDTQTHTWYVGERGDNYQVTVQTKDSEGKTVNRTETRVRWTHKAGKVQRFFDDTLVPASTSLPQALTKTMSEWDLKQMVEPRPEFLSGFTSESYSTTLNEGFEDAKKIMTRTIQDDVRRAIGGDHQRIHSLQTSWQDIRFKYIQLPVWTLTYRFNAKYYQVLVNGQTGKVSGQRPWSVLKIIAAVLLAAGIIGGIFFALGHL